jgi:predicted MPP superfamily phosphohydrolase
MYFDIFYLLLKLKLPLLKIYEVLFISKMSYIFLRHYFINFLFPSWLNALTQISISQLIDIHSRD